MGMDVGSPDMRFEIVHNKITYVLYLELKTKKGKLSKSQKEWNDRFDRHFLSANCKRDVAYGFTQAKEAISAWIDGAL